MKINVLLLLIAISFAANVQSQNQTYNQQIEAAIQLMDNGSVSSARSILEDLRKAYPDDYTVGYELAYACYLARDYKACIELLSKLVEHRDATDQTYAMLGNAYDMSGDRQKAQEMYQSGLLHFPKSGYLYCELGNIALLNKEYQKCENFYLRGIKADFTFTANYYRLAEFYFSSSRPSRGMILAEMYISIEGRDTKRMQQMSQYINHFSNVAAQTDTIALDISLQNKNQMSPENMGANLDLLYPLAYKAAMVKMKADSLSVEDWCKIRSAVSDVLLGDDPALRNSRNPYLLHLQAVRASGCENAYNHYLLLLSEPEELGKWQDAHPIEWKNFATWFGSYTPVRGSGDFF